MNVSEARDWLHQIAHEGPTGPEATSAIEGLLNAFIEEGQRPCCERSVGLGLLAGCALLLVSDPHPDVRQYAGSIAQFLITASETGECGHP